MPSLPPDPQTAPLIRVEDLVQLAGDPALRILDARFCLPGAPVPAREAWSQAHIPGALFFDIEQICDPQSTLPHMVPSESGFAEACSRLGISHDSRIVCYDDGSFMGAPRAWWMFRLFGFDRVQVLDGGLAAWRRAGQPVDRAPVDNTVVQADPVDSGRQVRPVLRGELIRNLSQMQEISTGACQDQVLDARSEGRFAGTAPEPRPQLPSGHMPGSLNLPFSDLVGPDGLLLADHALHDRFAAAGLDTARPVVATCGSGVTAATLALGLACLGRWDVPVYDGSWCEWAGSGQRIATGPAGH